jgi:hypothetical protein
MIDRRSTIPRPTKTGSMIDSSSTHDLISITDDITIPDIEGIAGISYLYRKVLRRRGSARHQATAGE